MKHRDCQSKGTGFCRRRHCFLFCFLVKGTSTNYKQNSLYHFPFYFVFPRSGYSASSHIQKYKASQVERCVWVCVCVGRCIHISVQGRQACSWLTEITVTQSSVSSYSTLLYILLMCCSSQSPLTLRFSLPNSHSLQKWQITHHAGAVEWAHIFHTYLFDWVCWQIKVLE